MNAITVLQSEKFVIAASLLSHEDALKMVGLSVEAFTDPHHTILFTMISTLLGRNQTVGPESIVQLLTVTDNKAVVDTVVQLVAEHSFVEDIDTHIELIREAWFKRQGKKLLEDAHAQLETWDKTALEIFSDLSQNSNRLIPVSRSVQHIYSGGGEEHGLYEERMRILERKKTTSGGLFTGWPEVDEMIPTGWATSDISVIAARTGIGKSALRFNLTRRFCDRGFGCVLISTEQSKEAETDRMDAVMTGIPLTNVIQSYQWADDDPRHNRLKEANTYMNEQWNYDMLFSRSVSLRNTTDFLQQVMQKREKHIIFYDLFDRLTDVNVGTNKPQVVTQRIGEAAAIADMFKVHVCLIVQINRSTERRSDRRPRISDLKDAGGYEEASRLILLLYRDAYYNPESVDDTMEICIAKQSQGPAGPGEIISCRFIGETTRVEFE